MSTFISGITAILVITPVTLRVYGGLGAGPIPFVVTVTVSSGLRNTTALMNSAATVVLNSTLSVDF